MMMKILKLSGCLLVLAALALQLCACAAVPPALAADSEDLMKGITSQPVEARECNSSFSVATTEFAVQLLQNSHADGKNTMLSPYSVLTALAMTANGADGETLEQMEQVFGLPIEELNACLYTCRKNEGVELVSANSIWIRNMKNFSPEEGFLQTNADYYGADAFTASFDKQTGEDINTWVRSHTKERIEKIIEEIDPLTMMYLVNVLTFDAEWESPYKESQIEKGEFHGAGGTTTVEMMHSTESIYLEDTQATGFRKDYRNGRYSFIALLPNEGISVEEYLSSLDGAALLQCVSEGKNCEVIATLPKFTADYNARLRNALAAMGMPDALSKNADFSRISALPLQISDVLHKTWLCVDESGTEAAAATAVEMKFTCALAEEPKTVYLDRPFVCGIYDNEQNMFLFLGVMNNIDAAE